MMEINVIAVGKIKEDYIVQGINEYTQRLSSYCNLNIIEVKEASMAGKNEKNAGDIIKKKEGERLLEKLPERGYDIALDARGKPMTSEGLAKSINNLQVKGHSSLNFLIGGSLGLSEEVLDSVDYSLALSRMTFTHQMIRLILLEQLYRAFKIKSNEPYHK
ncbi:23S rRNA (pseudouridine1915-N3)-methyltransferase [Halarsenatibacter silvermanii]|uniref:Ribosomal RNA large subunit methyltransferase H n=2 Tax=Halarsenatibacter silvermanii TaxID=321763 RepID=A0A1G9R037_9FIRM|nr:23S rRNA (pseudouridine1915-N3)-methyltransferase [Halarsenatibacter silvermanii]